MFKQVYHFNFSENRRVIPKDDYVIYCRDLAKQENAFFDENSMMGALKFTDMLDLAFIQNKTCLEILKKTSICLLIHAYPEFDPDYSHVGVYLKNKYALNGELFDVIAPSDELLSLGQHLLSQLIDVKKQQTGAILWFDQPIAPVSKFDIRLNKLYASMHIYWFP